MLFSFFKAIILGIVEGVTEFLPISSTGHLIIFNQWFSFSEPFTFVFDIVIQLGAILAVLVYFRKILWPFSKDQAQNQATRTIWFKTIIGVAPALVLGALLNNFIEKKLFNPWTVAIALIVGGIILFIVERKTRTSSINSIGEISYKTALAVGFVQCLAMIPGTSRSAATIIGAMLLGASRSVAAEFSFFLAIPTMIAASGYSLLKHGLAMTGVEAILLAIGFAVSFLTARYAIRFLMSFIQKHNFKLFAYYRIALGIIILLMFLFKIIE
jgi:undecaprenyl-diphosphatase